MKRNINRKEERKKWKGNVEREEKGRNVRES
jgi:hypothetical protein